MEFKNGTLGRAVLSAAIVAAATTATMGCSKEPQLNVQNAPQESPASAPAAEAAQATPGAPASGAAAGELPPGHPPTGGMAGGMAGGMTGEMPGGMAGGMGGMDASAIALPPVDPEGGLGAAGLVWDVPAGWVNEPPANPMRRAQYRVPGAAGDGELVVFYFGPNQGGPPLDNAQRWAMQFTQADGSDPLAALKTRTGDIKGIPALFVETTGTYNSGTMSGGPAVAMENWALLGAVAQGADANWFFKFTGPRKTVEAERAHFEALVGSLRRGS